MPDILNAFPLSVYRNPMAMDRLARGRMVEAVLEMAGAEVKKVAGKTWTGDVNGFSYLHQDPRFQELFAGFPAHLAGYLDHLKVDGDQLRLYYTRSWATVAREQESVEPHRHLQSHISLVYYLKKPANSGGLSFIAIDAPNQFAPGLFKKELHERGVLKQMNIFNAENVTLEAEEGDVVIFPSFTRHMTQPNRSDEPRISISVDIVVTVKDSDNLEFLLPDLDKWTPAA